MKSTILESRDELLLISINGRTQTVLDNPYNRLKYEMFDGNRIFYKFADNIELQETYDEGIFNCFVDGESMQLRCANKIAESIRHHKKTGSYDKFKQIFADEYSIRFQDRIIDDFLQYYIQTHRIEKIDLVLEGKEPCKAYQVDNRFCVDEHNQAYFWDYARMLDQCDEGKKTKTGWNKLCIVAKGEIPPQVSIQSPIGNITVEGRAIEIISKIFFLLQPNVNDKVFMEQLPKDLQEQLKRDVPKADNNTKQESTEPTE